MRRQAQCRADIATQRLSEVSLSMRSVTGGSVIARFRFGKRIGSGGFGVVRSATRIDADGNALDDQLAVKQLAPEHMDDDDAVGRFALEVRLLDRELDHANVMPVVDSQLEDDELWFVMPLADTNLAEQLDAGRDGDREWVTEVFESILEGVAHAHSRDVLHRDLKPPNVLFCGDVVKVSDFGLGKRLDPDATKRTKTDTWMGTEPYMAPEQFADAKRSENRLTSMRSAKCCGKCSPAANLTSCTWI